MQAAIVGLQYYHSVSQKRHSANNRLRSCHLVQTEWVTDALTS